MMHLMHSTANNKIKRGTTLPKTTVIARSTVIEQMRSVSMKKGSDVVSPMEQVDNIIFEWCNNFLVME